MDMSLREWLVLIGILVITVVIIDGYRRLRLARKSARELSFGLEEVRGDHDGFGSELPNGGARKQSASQSRPQERRSQRVEPALSGMDFVHEQDGQTASPELNKTSGSEPDHAPPSEQASEPPASSASRVEAPVADRGQGARKVRAEKSFAARTGTKDATPPAARRPGQPLAQAEAKTEYTEKLSDRVAATEVVVINVVVKGQDCFDGERLMQSILSSGMRFGDRAIFHRYSNDNGTGKILFSMANGVEPGRFDIDQLEQTATPILSFFMGLPGPEDPLRAFTRMVETARKLALDLGGELKDEQLSVMTSQTIEHCRQRIIDYERKQLTHKVPG